MPIIVVHNNPPDKIGCVSADTIDSLQQSLKTSFSSADGYYAVNIPQALSVDELTQLRSNHQLDINQLEVHHDIQLLISDMDSTMINIECVDEIADFAGRKAEVAAITESAMRGDIDFNTSLNQRVAVLKGLSVDVLQEIYQNRLRLNPGAEELIAGLKRMGIKTALVSGGFEYFAHRIKDSLGLDYVLANELDVVDDTLTGKVNGDIVNADVKAQFLKRICEQEGISTKQSIAVGDGANDLKMMHEAAMGVAYHAKPKVQKQAGIVLNYHGLDAILHLLHALRGLSDDQKKQ